MICSMMFPLAEASPLSGGEVFGISAIAVLAIGAVVKFGAFAIGRKGAKSFDPTVCSDHGKLLIQHDRDIVILKEQGRASREIQEEMRGDVKELLRRTAK